MGYMNTVGHEEKEIIDGGDLEVSKPQTVESPLGSTLELSDLKELGPYKVGDKIKFKRNNTFAFGNADFLSFVDDDELILEIVGVTKENTLVVKLAIIEGFLDQCTVEELNQSKIDE